MIFPVWQPRFSSTHILAQAAGDELGAATTHTGTLDPMASGVVVILSGEDRFAKGHLSDWDKTYNFSILWGVATDSLDALGMITEKSSHQPTAADIAATIATFPRKYHQKIPHFSARRWLGKSSFEYEVAPPPKTRAVTLSDFSLLTVESRSSAEIRAEHASALTKITGSFRQQEISLNWSRNLPASQMLVSQHQVTCSTGTYVRQIVADLSQKIGVPATTWEITRTRNGPYTLLDCSPLGE